MILAAALLTAGCDSKLSGEITTEETGVDCGYEILRIKGFSHVTCKYDSRTVAVTADKNLQKYVKIRNNGNMLTVDASHARIKATGDRPVTISVPYSSSFEELRMEGSSTFDFDFFTPPVLTINTKGSNIVTGILGGEKLIIKASGADSILVDQDYEFLDLELSGSCVAGTLMIPLRTADKADCKLTGSSIAYVEAGVTAGTAEDNSELHYVGDNRCRAKAFDSARIIHDRDKEPYDETKVQRYL